MAPKRKSSTSQAPCQHSSLCWRPSPHADVTGYARKSSHQLLAANEISGRVAARSTPRPIDHLSFPAPLVLPGDDLAYDTKAQGQTLCAWNRLRERIHVTRARSTVYVLSPPSVSEEVKFLNSWFKAKTPQPKMEDVISYLAAFYTGLQVKSLHNAELRFRRWDDEDEPAPARQAGDSSSRHTFPAIGLQYSECDVLQVRTRPCTDLMFKGQMNLNDLIDGCLEILPEDAFAMTMILPYDLFESDDDDFCCGRAFGGSRVSVVSTARYNPDLDVKQAVESEHAWPTSHCQEYITASCADHAGRQPRANKQLKTSKNASKTTMELEREIDHQISPLHAAVTAIRDMRRPASSSERSNLWLSRICKTASHELGHCLGIAHCPFYACIMQSTAGLSEDARQPPYLCPIDLAKVLKVTGSSEKEHLMALRQYCDGVRDDRLFRAFSAWLHARSQLVAEFNHVLRSTEDATL
nr:archaemetzincin-2 [Quercus suber]